MKNKFKYIFLLFLAAGLMFSLAGCKKISKSADNSYNISANNTVNFKEANSPTPALKNKNFKKASSPTPALKNKNYVKANNAAPVKVNDSKKKITICIDPGHQDKAIYKMEPLGPGSNEKKPGVSSGTRGVYTRVPEFQLNLEVALKVRAFLEKMGYNVVMTRDSNNVSITNIARAEIANKSGAELFVRIHADGSSSSSTKGFSVLYPAENDPYTKSINTESKLAAKLMEEQFEKATNAISRGIVPRSDLTGFNWSKVPSILIEMGFMSNKEEDIKLSTEDYQNKMAQGIANGIDKYISETSLK